LDLRASSFSLTPPDVEEDIGADALSGISLLGISH
jgi:hypothetical protein